MLRSAIYKILPYSAYPHIRISAHLHICTSIYPHIKKLLPVPLYPHIATLTLFPFAGYVYTFGPWFFPMAIYIDIFTTVPNPLAGYPNGTIKRRGRPYIIRFCRPGANIIPAIAR
jgi:hypothetical protein